MNNLNNLTKEEINEIIYILYLELKNKKFNTNYKLVRKILKKLKDKT